MISGGCLCGAVRFELDRAAGPFELCHCNRCRKVSGSAYMAGLGVLRKDFRWIAGVESIRRYVAPLVDTPPAYATCFCSTCGSPVPDPESDSEFLEIPAGLLEGDPAIRPDKHIFADLRAPWHEIADALPQLDRQALERVRAAAREAGASPPTPSAG